MINFKTVLLLLIVCLLGSAGYSQRFMQSVGVGFAPAGGKYYAGSGSGMVYNIDVLKLDRAGFLYFPRINLVERRYFSFSLGMPVMAGVSWATEHVYLVNPLSSYMPPSGPSGEMQGDKSLHFALELPVVADFNLALGSSRKNTDSIGLFVGGGYAWNHTTVTLSQGNQTLESYDPYLHAGIRFIRKHPISLGLSYRRNKQWGFQLMRDL